MMRRVAILVAIVTGGCDRGLALNPSLDISQYAHHAWTVRDGWPVGNTFAMAQTPDGYLWLGTEFGLFRFDGVRTIPWQPPAGQHLPDKPYSLLVTRDGTLWIGTYAGLATWSAGKLTMYPEVAGQFVTSLLEDREGTVWAGTLSGLLGTPGRLCAIRSGTARCYAHDGAFGSFVWGLYEDSAGRLWAGAESGLWRWKPNAPTRYAMPEMRISDLSGSGDGRLLIAVNGGGVMQFADGAVKSYAVRGPTTQANRPLRDREVNSNKLLRDRDGGLWIGTVERGLIHLHNGRTDVFTRADGLSGDIVLSLFEDREGTIWVATTGGLDRFRELPVTTISAKQGLPSDETRSVLVTTDGSLWIATYKGLTRWKNGQFTTFRKENGLPDDTAHSLYQDYRGRIWVSTPHGLGYSKGGRFVATGATPAGEVYSMTGDEAGNLWLSGKGGLSHLREGRLVEHFPWPALGRRQQAKVIVADQGGLWLSFWEGGGVLYFKDRHVRASYTTADGLGAGHVPGLRTGRDGAVWAATEDGGVSRIKDGRIATLTMRNGLPCNTIHWSIEDNDGSLWLYTACGLVRITRSELQSWIANPKRRIETTILDAADGVRLRSLAASAYGPTVARSTDGRLWFLAGGAVQGMDPRNLAINRVLPPVRIEQIRADRKPYALKQGLRLPPGVKDLEIDFTALSLAAPEKVHFKYKLEGQDEDWKEVVNHRQVEYTNLRPREYRFRVIASNNSGVWNETGDSLAFSVEPAFYQTNEFAALLMAAVFVMLWAGHTLRDRRLQRQYDLRLEERLEERTRIARELHDTLLQSFQGSLYLFQAARNLFSRRPEEALNTLDRAITSAENAIAEGRDSIQNLRDRPPQRLLHELLTGIGQEFKDVQDANGQPVTFQVTIEGRPQPISPLLQDEIYRIAREILRNAFKHACAQRIEAAIEYGSQLSRLRIRDDGKGIDPKVLAEGARAGHWGLPGIRERAKHIGAQLRVWSETGAGTEVELTLPASIAYAPPRVRRRFGLFRSRNTTPASNTEVEAIRTHAERR